MKEGRTNDRARVRSLRQLGFSERIAEFCPPSRTSFVSEVKRRKSETYIMFNHNSFQFDNANKAENLEIS